MDGPFEVVLLPKKQQPAFLREALEAEMELRYRKLMVKGAVAVFVEGFATVFRDAFIAQAIGERGAAPGLLQVEIGDAVDIPLAPQKLEGALFSPLVTFRDRAVSS
jgi:hypothetical protein